MALILCPECGSKISDKARTCPRCGYYCSDPGKPISSQESYSIVPLNVEIEVWGKGGHDELIIAQSEDKKNLALFLTEADRFEKLFPSVAANVKELLAFAGTEYRAKLTPELRRLMAEGKLSFKLDKQGEIMAILQNNKKHIANQIRLEQISFDASAAQSLSNLTEAAMFNQILAEIKATRDAIGALHVELQDDRLALAEASLDRLKQAETVKDSALRTSAILAAIGEATNAKHQLMRNFKRNRLELEENADKSVLSMMAEACGKGKAFERKADDAMEDLSLISAAVQVECAGWVILAEGESARYCLCEFRKFIKTNELDNSDTLLMINSHSGNDWIGLAKKFEGLTARIEGISKGGVPLLLSDTDCNTERG